MHILRVFNNNVVLARDDTGREIVLTGRGLGFQARPAARSTAARWSGCSCPRTAATPTTSG